MAAQLTRRDREFARGVLRLVLDSKSGVQEAQRLFDALTHDYDGDDVLAVAWAAEDADQAKDGRRSLVRAGGAR